MSGSNRLISNENQNEGASFEELASDLNNANEVAAEITDSKETD